MLHSAVFGLRPVLFAALTLAVACSDSAGPRQQPDSVGARVSDTLGAYTLVDLTPVLGSMILRSMNGAGQVLAIGESGEVAHDEPVYTAYLWDGNLLQPLPCSETLNAYLNDRGQVLCGKDVWEAGLLRPLILPDSVAWPYASWPYALSDSGEVAGPASACDGNPSTLCIFAYSNGQMRVTPVDSECSSGGVGRIADITGDVLSGTCLYQRAIGGFTPLDLSVVSYMNASAQIVGYKFSSAGGVATRAVYIHGDSIVTLGSGTANWINNRGDIVAVIDSLPVLLRHGAQTSLLHPVGDTTWTVTSPLLIDDSGRILAFATHGAPRWPSDHSTVLLTPRSAPVP